MAARMLFRTLPGILLLSLFTPVSAGSLSAYEYFTDRPGGDYHSYKADSLQRCSSSCRSIAKCQAYTYVQSTGICWMKETVPAPRHDPCCTSGVKVMGSFEINVDRLGGDLQPGFPTGTPLECQRACAQESQCRAYTWVKPGIQAASGMCWLKQAHMSKAVDDCCISGIKLRDPPSKNP